MPIYEYTCEKCGHEFETLLRGSEQPECPKCGSKKLNKILSTPSAHSHGSQGGSSYNFNRPIPT